MATKRSSWLLYLLLFLVGVGLLLVHQQVFNISLPLRGEYFYSSFFRNNYTYYTAIAYFVLGGAACYFFSLRPWFCGMALLLVFPIASLYEATVYRGSHNLIPLELLVYFFYALPAVAGAYLGRYLSGTRKKANSE